jgi:NitT/TauT family transport system substrate-binding protein
MTSASARSILGAVALGSCLALALTACGSEASSSSNKGMTELVAVVAPIQFEAAYLADELGYFEEQGLDVEIRPGADPTANIAMAMSGEADLITASWGVMTTSTAEGIPIRAVVGNGIVDAKSDNSGILVPEGSSVDEISDLENKTVAMVGVNTGGDIPMLQAMAAQGGDPASIKQVAVPYAGMQAALEQGTVDAAFPADSYYHQMVEAGYRVVSNPIREYQAYSAGTLWAATSSWLEENPDSAVKFSAAMKKAINYYNEPANIDTVRGVTARVNAVEVADVDPKKYAPMSSDFYVDAGQELVDAYEDLGLVETPLSAEEILWAEAGRTTK